MFSAVRPSLPALLRFARTPSIGRSIVALLAGALVLLMAVNVTTFVMIQRTAEFNDQVERSQQVRRSARVLLLSLVDAETGQRGFLLSGQPDFLAPYSRAEISVVPPAAKGTMMRTGFSGQAADAGVAGASESIAPASRAEARAPTRRHGTRIMEVLLLHGRCRTACG